MDNNQLLINSLTGCGLVWSQIKAMLIKRWAFTYRNPLTFLVQIFIVVIFVLLAIFAANSLLSRPDLPPIKLDLEFYEKTTTVFEVTDAVADRAELFPYVNVTFKHIMLNLDSYNFINTYFCVF